MTCFSGFGGEKLMPKVDNFITNFVLNMNYVILYLPKSKFFFELIY